MTTGHKIERATDVTIQLPGRDYELTREYTSDTDFYVKNSSGNYFWNGQYGTIYPGRLGAGWEMNGEKYLQGVGLGSGVPPRLYLRSSSQQSSKRFDQLTTLSVWVERGGANRFITPSTGSVYTLTPSSSGPQLTTLSANVLRMVQPGSRSTIGFVGHSTGTPTADTLEVSDLAGKIAYERDQHGNFWYYVWSSLGELSTSTRDTVRLRAIYFNGTPGNELARIEFHWHGDETASSSYSGTTSTDARYGRLAEAMVYRPDGSSSVLTNTVRYLYFDDIANLVEDGDTITLGEVYDGSPGDLVEVISSTLMSDGSDFHEKVYQYRYYSSDNNSLGASYSGSNGIGLIEPAGRDHQLMAAIYPEQIEYYADYLMQEAIVQNATTGSHLDNNPGLFSDYYGAGFAGAPDAAELLRWVRFNNNDTLHRHDNWEAMLLPNDRWQSLYDIAGKIIAYYPDSSAGGTDGWVQTQVVSSGDGTSSSCGCGSATPGMNLGKRYDYVYRRYVFDTDIIPTLAADAQSNGYSTQVVESVLGFSGSSLVFKPYRVECHDYYWSSPLAPTEIAVNGDSGSRHGVVKLASATVPANASWNFSPTTSPIATSGDGWASVYEYDLDTDPTSGQFTNYRKLTKVLTPSAVGISYVAASATASPEWEPEPTSGLIHWYTYEDGYLTEQAVSNGHTGTQTTIAEYDRSETTRPDLPNQIVREPGEGPAGHTPTETTTITRGYFGNTNGTPPSGNEADAVVAWERVKREAETEAQNGPASPVDYSEWKLWDQQGQLRWTRDANGTLTCYAEYDDLTGMPTMIVRDADPSATYATGLGFTNANFPGIEESGSEWSVPTRSSYEELTETFEVDLLGRVTQHTDPGGVTTRFVYETRVIETVSDSGTLVDRGVPYKAKLTYPHRYTDGSDYVYSGPVSLSVSNVAGKPILSEAHVGSSSWSTYPPTTTPLLDSPVARSEREYSLSGSLASSRDWHDTAATPAAGSYVTRYEYDALGRLKATIDPEGGVMMYGWKSASSEDPGYDLMDRVIRMSEGLDGNDNSFRLTSRMYYDSLQTDTQGIGNGNLTYQEVYTGETTGGTRVTKRWYDYRDRLIGVVNPLAPHQSMAYDDLGRVVETATFTTDSNFGSGGVPAPSSNSDRSTYTQTYYNNRGMVFRTRVAIDPTQSAPEFLESNRWLDAVGNTIASWDPSGPATKTVYDSLNRQSVVYVTDRAGDALPGASGNYAHAASVTDDHVLEQTEYLFVADDDSDDRGAGSVELVTHRMRLHELGGIEGEEGPLVGTTSVAVYTLYEFDQASRAYRSHNYGTNDDSFTNGTSPPARPSNSVSLSAGSLVSETGFDEWGRAVLQISPDGDRILTVLDSMSRQIALIEAQTDVDATSITWGTSNWSVAFPSPVNADRDRVTTFVYDGLSNIVLRTAWIDDSSIQSTEYVYGVSPSTSSPPIATDSFLSSSRLLWKVHYPNESTGVPDADPSYTVTYGYNTQGELRGMSDQNGTVHAYARDALGRVTSDLLEAVGTNIDGTIDKIATMYDDHGRVSAVTSYDGTSEENGVLFTYTPLHQIAEVYQNHAAAASTSSPYLRYNYATAEAHGTNGGNYSRVSGVDYPTDTDNMTSTVAYGYGATGSIDDRISRLVEVDVTGWDGSNPTIVDYKYLGLATPVQVHYPVPRFGLDYTMEFDGDNTLGTYPGFDQFGRVTWHAWISDDYTNGTNTGFPDRTPLIARSYAYDLDSNRTRDWDARPGAVPNDRDWAYQYDPLDRLAFSFRGRHTPGASTSIDEIEPLTDFVVQAGSYRWDLDTLGNWSTNFIDDDTADPIVWENNGAERRDRTFNKANEIVSHTKPGAGGTSQIITQPTYDAAGNYRQNLPSTSGASTLRYTHDGWNRLVKIEKTSSSTVILENSFNGLNWRIRRKMDLSQGAYNGVDEERLYFFTASWQMIEEWVDDDLDSAVEYRAQQFWGVRYIDDAVARRLDRDNDGAWTTDPEDNWYYLTDVMFSVRGITDNDGQIHTRVDYTPYGVAMHRYAADVNGDGLINYTDITTFNSNAGSGLEPGDTGYDPDTDLNGDGFAEDYLTAEWPLFYDTRYTPYSAGGSNPTVNAGWIDNPTDSNGPDNSVGYDGYHFDLAGATDATSTGLYMVRHRVYEPGMGRWAQRDPNHTRPGFESAYLHTAYWLTSPAEWVGTSRGFIPFRQYEDGSSLLAYAKSAPTRYLDHRGLAACTAEPHWANCPVCSSLPPCTGDRIKREGLWDCSERTANPAPGYAPTPNGCGTPNGPWVPDSLWGINMTSACDNHDVCYGTCGSSKQQCDDALGRDVLINCYLQGHGDLWCMLVGADVAGKYSLAVKLFGHGAYQKAQDKACAWRQCRCR